MNKLSKWVLFLVLLFTSFFQSGSISAEAAPVEQGSHGAGDTCFSLDVLFIVDQSGSMSGEGTGRPSDPLDNRAYAPRWAIDWLTDNAMDQCPDAIHRVGVISFGSDAEVDLQLREIDPLDYQDAIRMRKEYKSNLEPVNLGETDPLEAFQKANELFNNAGSGPNYGKNRKRVIIFITDGEPQLEEFNRDYTIHDYREDLEEYVEETFSFDEDLLELEKCLRNYRNLVRQEFGTDVVPDDASEQKKEEFDRNYNQCLTDNPISENAYKESIYIWTLLMRKGTPWPDADKDILREISNTNGGEMISLAQNLSEIPETFLSILSSLSGVEPTQLQCGSFAMNPYLSEARLTFFKVSDSTTVNLSYTDALGTVHTVEDGVSDSGFNIKEHNQEGANERYVIADPYPGIWEFRSDDCQGIYAYYEPIPFNIGKYQPIAIKNSSGDQFSPSATYEREGMVVKGSGAGEAGDSQQYYLQYSVQDEEGNVVENEEKALFGIIFDVILSSPAGNEQNVEMEWLPDEQVFQSIDPLSLPVQGDYQINVTGETVFRNPPYGPLNTIKDSDIFGEDINTKELFRIQDSFQVDCPDLDDVQACPWKTVTQEDGCPACERRTFSFEILKPGNGETIRPIHKTILKGWPLKVNPLEIEFQVNADDLGSMQYEDLFTDPEHPFRVTLSAGGETKEVDYQRNGNIYQGTIAEWESEGAHEIVLTLDTQVSDYFSPEVESVQSSFSREDLLWNQPEFYRGVFYALIGLLLVLAVRGYWIRRHPLKGSLIFRQGGHEIAHFSLNSSKNFKEIKADLLEQYPELDLSKLRVVNIPADKKKSENLDDGEFSIGSIDEGMGQGGERKIRVEGKRLEDGGAFDIVLFPGTPMDYSANSIAMMVYEPPEDYS